MDRSLGKKLKDKIFGQKKKHEEIYDQVFEFLVEGGKKKAKKSVEYVLVDRVDTKMTVRRPRGSLL